MAKLYELSKDGITIKVKGIGAELVSIFDQTLSMEYMWCGDPEYWGRTSPILFPFVGRIHDAQYQYKGKTYQTEPHGFAKRKEFELISSDDSSLLFELTDDEETRACYPFSFSLQIGYKIEKKCIQVSWRVKNTGNSEMYFSIGGHPAFVCPLNKGEKRSDYFIGMEGKEKVLNRLVDMNTGFVTEEYKEILLKDEKLPITDHLFDSDALVLEEQAIKKLYLATPDGKPYVSLTMDAPIFGIWSSVKPASPFVCFEPWFGRCDAIDYHDTFENREWQQKLLPEALFEKEYTIQLHQ